MLAKLNSKMESWMTRRQETWIPVLVLTGCLSCKLKGLTKPGSRG